MAEFLSNSDWHRLPLRSRTRCPQLVVQGPQQQRVDLVAARLQLLREGLRLHWLPRCGSRDKQRVKKLLYSGRQDCKQAEAD